MLWNWSIRLIPKAESMHMTMTHTVRAILILDKRTSIAEEHKAIRKYDDVENSKSVRTYKHQISTA